MNHYDCWPILTQSTRNLIIEGSMFNYDTPWKNILSIPCKDVMTIKNEIYLKFNFVKSHNFAWYLEKEKRYHVETLAIDLILNKEHFYGRPCRKCAPNASPRPLFYFGTQPKTAIACKNFLKNKIFWKAIKKNLLKSKLYFFFPAQFPLMEKIIKNKRDLKLVTSTSSGYKTSQKSLFISYILSHQVWWYYMKRFLSYPKNYIFKFMQANAWHH